MDGIIDGRSDIVGIADGASKAVILVNPSKSELNTLASLIISSSFEIISLTTKS